MQILVFYFLPIKVAQIIFPASAGNMAEAGKPVMKGKNRRRKKIKYSCLAMEAIIEMTKQAATKP